MGGDGDGCGEGGVVERGSKGEVGRQVMNMAYDLMNYSFQREARDSSVGRASS